MDRVTRPAAMRIIRNVFRARGLRLSHKDRYNMAVDAVVGGMSSADLTEELNAMLDEVWGSVRFEKGNGEEVRVPHQDGWGTDSGALVDVRPATPEDVMRFLDLPDDALDEIFGIDDED